MTRTYKLMVWTGKRYQIPDGLYSFEARGPQDAIKKAGLDDPMYEITYSRKGYGHYTGRIEVRAPETVAAAQGLPLPLPADFVILATN